MLTREALDRVPWAELKHAYGAAKDTPGHLLDLESADDKKWARALNDLRASICHQGSVYQGSCAAVPFLIEILADMPDERKPAILGLLAGLAHSDWYASRDAVVLQVKHEWPKPTIHERWSIGHFLREGNKYYQEPVPEPALDMLVDAIVTPEQMDELYQMLPFGSASVHVEACRALSHIGVPDGFNRLLVALGRGAARWRVVDTVRVAEAVLDLAFFGDWVDGRRWGHSTERPISLETAVAEMFHGNTNPYEERSYHNYGRFRDGKPEFRITCYGYDEGAAKELA